MRFMATRPKLDRIDRQILRALQKDARLSNKELAAQVGLAASSALERVRRLRREGVLVGFRAEVDGRALGIELEAFVMVRMNRHSRETLERLRTDLMQRPEVAAFYAISGAFDLLVHVAVASTDHLRDFTLDAIAARPEVTSVETSIVFEQHRPQVCPSLRGPD